MWQEQGLQQEDVLCSKKYRVLRGCEGSSVRVPLGRVWSSRLGSEASPEQAWKRSDKNRQSFLARLPAAAPSPCGHAHCATTQGRRAV